MKRLTVLIAVGALALAACSTSVEDATAAYCEDLDALNAAIASASQLTATSGLGAIEDAANEIADAFDEARASAQEVADAAFDEIEPARDDFRNAVDSINESSLAEGIANVQTAAVAYAEAVRTTISKVDCSSTSE